MKNKNIWKIVNKKEVETTEEDTQEEDMESYLVSQLHDLWVCHNCDSMKVVLFLEEWKTYWQARAIAEMCEYNGALGDFLKSGIETGIREDR